MKQTVDRCSILGDAMTAWEYQHMNLAPGEDYFQALRLNGDNGWEAWHMERDERGWRTIYFKRPKPK